MKLAIANKVRLFFNDMVAALKAIPLTLFLGCSIPVCAQTRLNGSGMDDDQPFITWAKQHALTLQHSDSATGYADLIPMKKIVAKARVVELGEPAHGFHEPLAFRNRLFRFLAENCGFTTIVLEAGLAESRLAADFIRSGKGSAEEAAANMTIGKPSVENIALLKWMRNYNANPSHKTKLKIYGMDIQIRGLPGDTTPAHEALDQALNYLRRTDPPFFEKIGTVLKPYLNRLSVANYPLLTAQEHDRLSAALDDLIAAFVSQRINFIAKSSAAEYEWAYHNAIVARQTDRMVRVMPPDQPGKIPPEAWLLMNSRDAAMAENVIWILNTQAKEDKIFVFAHNAHVKNAATTGSVWDAFTKPPNATGQYLRSLLGEDLYIIGTSAGASKNTAQPGSLDKALRQVGKARFFLDLKPAAAMPLVSTWLSAVRPMEANTVAFLKLAPGKAFDGIVFIDKTQ